MHLQQQQQKIIKLKLELIAILCIRNKRKL